MWKISWFGCWSFVILSYSDLLYSVESHSKSLNQIGRKSACASYLVLLKHANFIWEVLTTTQLLSVVVLLVYLSFSFRSLTEKFEADLAFRDQGIAFVNRVTDLLQLLLEYRYIKVVLNKIRYVSRPEGVNLWRLSLVDSLPSPEVVYGSICKGYIFTTQKWLVNVDSPNPAWHALWLAEAKKTCATFQPIRNQRDFDSSVYIVLL